MSSPARIHPLLRVPPPLLFVLTFLAGAGLQRLVPPHFLSAVVQADGRIAGIGLLGASGLLALCCLGMFLWMRTTVIPHSTASKLITWGPYGVTRNPMYLSLVLAYLGAALLLGQVWPLALLPLPVILVHTIVIPFEETRLREAFGESYEQYCARVHRWV